MSADLSKFVEAKSDQLNGDDLLSGPRNLVVRDVKETGDKEQPIAVYFEGDNGKPYKPGKSMRRVLMQVWAPKGSDWPKGATMTVYRDASVTFGKLEVGGIRISHMSHIDSERVVPLTVRQGQKAAYRVKPLQTQSQAPAEATIEDARGAIKGAADSEALERAWRSKAMAPFRDQLQAEMEARKAQFTTPTQGADDDDVI
jgi:hypothetical protein